MGKSAFRILCLFLALLLTGAAAAQETRTLIPGGQLVGVTVKTDGLIYVGASDLGTSPSPARLSGLKNGDVIKKINGKAVKSAQSLLDEVVGGKENTLEVSRNGETMQLRLTPVTDPRDGKVKIGAWVRESVAGLGTLTYIDPATGEFAALGHAISDPDAGLSVPISGGTVYDAQISGITKGKRGEPGELSGSFLSGGKVLGTISQNASGGIKGTFTKANIGDYVCSGPMETAGAGEVRTGHAEIISTVQSTGPEVYSIDILSIDNTQNERNLLIRVTDQTLLNATGGIVQGMSGSPIIQDGKLVGAVTHVLVNDPTRGYGIFIENMLDAAG